MLETFKALKEHFPAWDNLSLAAVKYIRFSGKVLSRKKFWWQRY